MEQLSIETVVDSCEVQCPPIEELSNSGVNNNNSVYRIRDISEEPQEMENNASHSVGMTRRGRSPMSTNDDVDFTPHASSTRIMSKPKSRSRGPAARMRSNSQQRQQSPSIKPKKTRQRSKTRKSSASKQGSASRKSSKSRSRSRSVSKGRMPAAKGRRVRM